MGSRVGLGLDDPAYAAGAAAIGDGVSSEQLAGNGLSVAVEKSRRQWPVGPLHFAPASRSSRRASSTRSALWSGKTSRTRSGC